MANATAQTKEPSRLASILARAAALEARHGESMRALSGRLVGAARSAAFDPVTAGSAEQGQNAAGDSARQTSMCTPAHPGERLSPKPLTDREILEADAAALGLTMPPAASAPAKPQASEAATSSDADGAGAHGAQLAADARIETPTSSVGASASNTIGHALGSTRGLRVDTGPESSGAGSGEGSGAPSLPAISAAGGAAPVMTGDCADAASSIPPAADGPPSGGQPLRGLALELALRAHIARHLRQGQAQARRQDRRVSRMQLGPAGFSEAANDDYSSLHWFESPGLAGPRAPDSPFEGWA